MNEEQFQKLQDKKDIAALIMIDKHFLNRFKNNILTVEEYRTIWAEVHKNYDMSQDILVDTNNSEVKVNDFHGETNETTN